MPCFMSMHEDTCIQLMDTIKSFLIGYIYNLFPKFSILAVKNKKIFQQWSHVVF